MTFTQHDLWAIEFNERHRRGDLNESLAELHLLIDTLLYLDQTLSEAKVQIPYWKKSSETLLIKFAFHGYSLHQILSGVELRSVYYPDELNGQTILDTGTAKTILRAQLEAFLMFHHIYVNPANDDEKELRFCAWIYSGLSDRQNFAGESIYAQQQRRKDQESMANYRVKMQSLQSFRKLSEKQQCTLLTKGSGKLFRHWATILEDTGFSKNHFVTQLYALLSIYAHSEGITAVQMEDAAQAEHTPRQAAIEIHNSKTLTALLIRALVRLFKIVEIRYNSLPPKLQFDIGFYCAMSDVKQ